MVKVASRIAPAAGPCRAPYVVIDESGFEVGVLVDYAHFLGLMDLVAVRLGREVLPGYWQMALDSCMPGVVPRQGAMSVEKAGERPAVG